MLTFLGCLKSKKNNNSLKYFKVFQIKSRISRMLTFLGCLKS